MSTVPVASGVIGCRMARVHVESTCAGARQPPCSSPTGRALGRRRLLVAGRARFQSKQRCRPPGRRIPAKMCRFIAYLGPRLPLDALVTRPRNSLIHKSFHSEEREEPLNGDGFGLAWWKPDISLEPALFRSLTPAWSNRN